MLSKLQRARELLDGHAGRMSKEQALELGSLLNSDNWGGIEKHSRFSPAFVGAGV
jgi:hypothetical protein